MYVKPFPAVSHAAQRSFGSPALTEVIAKASERRRLAGPPPALLDTSRNPAFLALTAEMTSWLRDNAPPQAPKGGLDRAKVLAYEQAVQAKMREFMDRWLVVAREAKTQYMATLGKDFGGANLDGTMPPITAGPNAVARPGQAAS